MCSGSTCLRRQPASHWADHVTGWTRDGRPAVLVSQPYTQPTVEGITADLAEECPGVTVRVDPAGGWYGHGTSFVELLAPERAGRSA